MSGGEREKRERLGGGREQKNEKALDGEEGTKERLREREVNELERAGGKCGARGGGVYEVIEKWGGGAEGGEVSHKTRERME